MLTIRVPHKLMRRTRVFRCGQGVGERGAAAFPRELGQSLAQGMIGVRHAPELEGGQYLDPENPPVFKARLGQESCRSIEAPPPCPCNQSSPLRRADRASEFQPAVEPDPRDRAHQGIGHCQLTVLEETGVQDRHRFSSSRFALVEP